MAIINRFRVLLAEKELTQGQHISLREVSRKTQLSLYTVNGFANNSLKAIPLDALEAICRYLGCQPGDILTLDETCEIPATKTPSPSIQPADTAEFGQLS